MLLCKLVNYLLRFVHSSKINFYIISSFLEAQTPIKSQVRSKKLLVIFCANEKLFLMFFVYTRYLCDGLQVNIVK